MSRAVSIRIWCSVHGETSGSASSTAITPHRRGERAAAGGAFVWLPLKFGRGRASAAAVPTRRTCPPKPRNSRSCHEHSPSLFVDTDHSARREFQGSVARRVHDLEVEMPSGEAIRQARRDTHLVRRTRRLRATGAAASGQGRRAPAPPVMLQSPDTATVAINEPSGGARYQQA